MVGKAGRVKEEAIQGSFLPVKTKEKNNKDIKTSKSYNNV